MIKPKPCNKPEAQCNKCPYCSEEVSKDSRCAPVSDQRYCTKWRYVRGALLRYACEELDKETVLYNRITVTCPGWPGGYTIQRASLDPSIGPIRDYWEENPDLPSQEACKARAQELFDQMVLGKPKIDINGPDFPSPDRTIEILAKCMNEQTIEIEQNKQDKKDLSQTIAQMECKNYELEKTIRGLEGRLMARDAGIRAFQKERDEAIARVTCLEERLSRSIENNGLNKQARINALAEEVRKLKAEIEEKNFTIAAQAHLLRKEYQLL